MTHATYDYAGKVALVTGAASGIGRATALQFASAGASVVIADINETSGSQLCDQIVAFGGRALFRRTDVSRFIACHELVSAAGEAFGRLDFCFNNAGIVGRAGAVGEVTQMEWSAIIDVNLTGIFNCLASEVELMTATGGVIVNNASIMGVVGANAVAAYSASKHGVIGLTRSAAMDYGRAGIRVNAICPGFVKTPMTAGTDVFTRKVVEAGIRRCALRREALPDEIAAAVLWLCSDSASFITGAALPIDGGYTAN